VIALFFAFVAWRPVIALAVMAAVFVASGPVAKLVGFLRRRRATI
jgi:hypothetical protein